MIENEKSRLDFYYYGSLVQLAEQLPVKEKVFVGSNPTRSAKSDNRTLLNILFHARVA